MAIRDDFTAGEVLAAADLNDTFASKIPFSYGTATPSTTVEGFVWYDENSTPPAPKFWDGAAFQALGGGKVLQVVRATDTTNRSTTSTSAVDASISVTITPQKSTSTILILWNASVDSSNTSATDQRGSFIITDSSNVAQSGAELVRYGVIFSSNMGVSNQVNAIAYASPATISPVTYKVRFFAATASTTIQIVNASSTGQMYAIEVSA